MKYPTPEERLLATQPQPEPQPGDMPSAAHDVPAAKLRERLAQAERELAEAKADCKRYLDRIDELTKESDRIYKDKQGTDRVLRDIRYAMHLDVGYDIIDHAEFLYMYRRNQDEVQKKLTIERDSLRAEADKWKSECEMYANAWVRETNGVLRQAKTHLIDELVLLTRSLKEKADKYESERAEAARLREQVAALQPYADMAAGLLAEKSGIADESEEHRERYNKRANSLQDDPFNRPTIEYWKGRRDEAGWFRDQLQPAAPRPDAQEEKR